MKILLMCNAGMSTSMMMMKMRQAAQKKGLDIDIKAAPVSELDEYEDGIDCFLLGPQIKFAEKDVKSKITDRPVLVIDMALYGSMNGEKVLDNCLAAMNA